MGYLPMILGIALISVGLLAVSGQAHAAMPVSFSASFRRGGLSDRQGRLLLSPSWGCCPDYGY